MVGKGGSDVPCLMELKAAEAARRLTTDGPNELPSGDHCGGLRIVTDVLRSYGPRPDLLAVSQVWQGEVRQTACLVATKRAPEAAAALCRLSPQDHDSMAQAANAMAKSGLRVLAIACGTAADRLPQTQHDLTLTFLGLVGLADPFRESVHIGIAMGGRGTDVAREAAAIVLLDDDFGSIVRAVRLGRRIYDNLRKAVSFIFAVHLPATGLAILPLMFGLPVMLAPIHIAFLEMVIDPVCTLVFEAEDEEADIMGRPPRNPDDRLFSTRSDRVEPDTRPCRLCGSGGDPVPWRTTADARGRTAHPDLSH